jgi:DNA-binding CsgD family transcriptional regulator
VVGRSVELAVLTATARRAAAGAASAVLVSGPAGIGKSSLLAALSDSLRADGGVTVLSAECHEVTSGISYGAVRALFAPLGLGEAPAASTLLRGAARWAVAALRTDDTTPVVDDAAQSYQVLHGLYWLAANVMADRPLVIVLDDVNWCDTPSLRFLDFLLRRADDLPLLVVLSRRTGAADHGDATLTQLVTQPRVGALALAPLGRDDVRAIVVDLLGAEPDAEFVRACAEVTSGNPLLVNRLLDELARCGVRADATGIAAVREVGNDVLAVSAAARLAAQPASVRSVARAVAVLTGTVHGVGHDLVAELADVPPSVLPDALAALRQIDVLDTTELAFVHDSVRAVTLDAIEPDAAARLRARAARLLNDSGRPVEEVANQLLLLPDLPESWMTDVLREAAASAKRRGAPETAVRYLAMVLDAGGDGVAQPQVRADLARPLAQLDPGAALDQFRVALSGTTDPRQRAALSVQFAFTSLGAHRAPEGVRVLADALDGLDAVLPAEPSADDLDLRAQVVSALLITGGDEKSTIARVRDMAARMVPPEGRSPGERQVLGMMAMLAASTNQPTEHVVALARRAVAVRAGTGDWAMLSAAQALHLADDIAGSLAVFGWVVDVSRAQASAWTHSLALASRAHVLYSAGDVREGLADAETAVAIADEGGWSADEAHARTILAINLVAYGDPERAEQALDRIRRPGFDRFAWEWHLYLLARGEARWLLGDLDASLEHLLRCGRSLEEAGITNPVYAAWWVDAACVAAQHGKARQARELVESGQDAARQWGTRRAIGVGLLAEGSISGGRRAVDLLTEAVHTLSDSPARLSLAHAEFRLGSALLRVDDLRAAREHLRAAADQSILCGAQALTVAAGRLHSAAGGRRRLAGPHTVDILTGAERRVAAMAARGHSNRDIAEALFVTVRTVEVHLTNTYRKLGINGRPELATEFAVVAAVTGEIPGMDLTGRNPADGDVGADYPVRRRRDDRDD